MSSPRGVPLLGDQEPRLSSLPPFDSDVSGRNAVSLAEVAGLELDPWQRLVLESGLRRRGSKWAAFEVALIVARQNGKGTVLEALELAALFLFPDVRLILFWHRGLSLSDIALGHALVEKAQRLGVGQTLELV